MKNRLIYWQQAVANCLFYPNNNWAIYTDWLEKIKKGIGANFGQQPVADCKSPVLQK